jgi:hypothetical protein
MDAVFSPIGGGRIGKAEAFDILAEGLGIEDRPLSAARLDLFYLVLGLGRHFAEAPLSGNAAEVPVECWDVMGGLYHGLAHLEAAAMKQLHADNLALHFITVNAGYDAAEKAASAA